MVVEPSEGGKEVKMRSLYSKILGGHWVQVKIASVMVNGQLTGYRISKGADLQACL